MKANRQGPPNTVLLATDLSARSDRALDRATSLVSQWKASLVILHALEKPEPELLGMPEHLLPSWKRSPDPANLARRHLRSDLHQFAETAKIIVGEGDAADLILQEVKANHCELIVTGIARDELMGRFTLGKTVDRLLRRSEVPILVVKDKPRHSYRHIVVAVDFSEASRYALETAIEFFPEQQVAVFHAYDAPLLGQMSDPSAYQSQYRKVALQECEAFLNNIAKDRQGWHRPQVLIEHGAPERLLRDYVRDMQADLVVLGTHGRSALIEVALGSVAKQIMSRTPCDALVVPRRGGAGAD